MSIEHDPQPGNFGQQDFVIYEDTPDENSSTEPHQRVECPNILAYFALRSCLFLHQFEKTSSRADYSVESTGTIPLVTSRMANLNPSVVTISDEEVCFLRLVYSFITLLLA